VEIFKTEAASAGGCAESVGAKSRNVGWNAGVVSIYVVRKGPLAANHLKPCRILAILRCVELRRITETLWSFNSLIYSAHAGN